MHRIAIIATEVRPEDDLIFQERVTLADLKDPHIAHQLLERLTWALQTADVHPDDWDPRRAW
ncbi:hypothetical protein DSM104299_00184 [Baekduia alba]|uniref:hypothetical protein n=1 Tax=Baekduia alba TaxID=2997333 RepID=UPI00233FB3BD|nr:hypothetical protein [Baekduia alba]WCB91513.1 hypothetical protein DSM104299_00184 [Baekduia alba]